MLWTWQTNLIACMDQTSAHEFDSGNLTAIISKKNTGFVMYYSPEEVHQLAREIISKKLTHKSYICELLPNVLMIRKKGIFSYTFDIFFKNILQLVSFKEDKCMLFLLCRKRKHGSRTFCAVLNFSSSDRVSELVNSIISTNSDAAYWNAAPKVVTMTGRGSLYY